MKAWHNGFYPDVPNYGFHSEPLAYTEQWFNRHGQPYGPPSQYYVINNVDVANRWGKSSNPITLIDGVVPWRRASTYKRQIQKYTYRGGTIQGQPNWEGSYWIRQGVSKDVRYIVDYLMSWPADGNEPIWELRNRARVECLNKLAQRKANLGAFLVEAQNSAEHLARSFSDFLGAYKRIKRGQPPVLFSRNALNKHGYLRTFTPAKAAQVGYDVSGSAAGGYLAYKYGWRPLMSDLYDQFQISAESLKKPLLMTAKRTVSGTFSNPNQVPYWENRSQHVGVKHKCQITAKVSDSLRAGVESLGLGNPLAAAWELVPLSFVLDWAAPIGSYLEALTATNGLEFVDGFEGHRTYSRCRGTYMPSDAASGSPIEASIERLTYTRSALGGFPAPLPYVLENPFTLPNVTSALALWRSAFRK